MNWDALQALAEIVAAVGVLVSLVYLASQIRNNTASLRAGTVSRVAEHWSGLRREIWSNPETARLYALAISGEAVDDPLVAMRVRAYWLNILKDTESTFYQHLSGQLPDEIWHGYRRELGLQLSTPGARDALAGWGGLLSEPFHEFVQAELRAIDGDPLAEFRGRYDGAAAVRRAGSSRRPGVHRAT